MDIRPRFVRKKLYRPFAFREGGIAARGEPMQVLCGTCQLSFDAPEGATGLVCPICRGPLRSQAAPGRRRGEAAARKTVDAWSGGALDDLIAILSAPAISARVEVLGRDRRHGARRGPPAGGRRLGLDLRRQGDRRRARQAARGQADPLPRRAAAAQPRRRRPQRARARRRARWTAGRWRTSCATARTTSSPAPSMCGAATRRRASSTSAARSAASPWAASTRPSGWPR